MSLTQATKAGIDAARKLMGQSRLKFELLKNNNAGDERGYTTLAVVKTGWVITEPSKSGQPELFLVESRQATDELIRQTRAVAVGGRVYKLDGDARQTPMGGGLRLFSWNVKPTGEPHP